MKKQRPFYEGNETSHPRKSNSPYYVLPATACAIAKVHGLAYCIHELRLYARQLQLVLPLAHEYAGCVYQDDDTTASNLYAIFRNANHTGYHIMAINSKGMLYLPSLLAFINDCPMATQGLDAWGTKRRLQLFLADDSASLRVHKTMFVAVRENWVSFQTARQMAHESGHFTALEALWDLDQEYEDVRLPHRAHISITCGHCSTVLQRSVKSYRAHWIYCAGGTGVSSGLAELAANMSECSECRMVFVDKALYDDHRSYH
jgi:hypothetical protein